MLNSEQGARYLALRRALIEQRFSRMNEMQRQAVLTTEGPLLILAGAGSGKTTVLINRIANLLLFGTGYRSGTVPFWVGEDDLSWLEQAKEGRVQDDAVLRRLLAENPPRPWEILAITFTNKAAGELRARLSTMLGEQEGGQIHASTFHSACVRILRSEIEHLGYRSGFVIYDSDDSQKVVREALKELNLDDKTFAPRAVLAKISECRICSKRPPIPWRGQKQRTISAFRKSPRSMNATSAASRSRTPLILMISSP